MLAGWKTYVGVAIEIVTAGLYALGYDEFAKVAGALGLALIGVGIRGKLERTDPGA